MQQAARDAGSSVDAMAGVAEHEVERHDDAFVTAKASERHAEETLEMLLAVLEEGTPRREQAKGLLGLLQAQRSKRRSRTGCEGEWC